MNNQSKNKEKENYNPPESIFSGDYQSEKVLCHHCLRTANNGIRCLGMCVADNDY